MDIIYETDRSQFQSVVVPEHSRTIRFSDKLKYVKIPKSIVIIEYDKINSEVYTGMILNFNLTHWLNFRSFELCTNGLHIKNIQEYISWYWASEFRTPFRSHTRLTKKYFKLCDETFCIPLYLIVKKYHPNKFEKYNFCKCYYCKDHYFLKDN